MDTAIDKALAEALSDLSLDPLSSQGDLDDSLIAGYSLPEMGASNYPPAPCWVCCCCCSCND